MEGIEMTPEEQRIAIAEACGWKTGYRDPEAWHPLPDYLNDLNAMHDAEKVLTVDQFEQYRWILWDICKQVRVKDWYRCYLSSTAAQRAEAFLRTIGEWKECK
jgi:hypothetical protein